MTALFITFEGLDGGGKSTQLVRAGRWLAERGVDAVCAKEPGGTPVGEAIRAVFLDPRWHPLDGGVEALLVFASRRQNLIEVIGPALAAGRHVLCDRFTDSSLVYQGAVRGLGYDWIAALDRLATGGRRPDHTLLFDLPSEEAFARRRASHERHGDADRLDAEDLDFYRRVREAYFELRDREPGRFHLIDASGSVEATWEQVERILGRLLEVDP